MKSTEYLDALANHRAGDQRTIYRLFQGTANGLRHKSPVMDVGFALAAKQRTRRKYRGQHSGLSLILSRLARCASGKPLRYTIYA